MFVALLFSTLSVMEGGALAQSHSSAAAVPASTTARLNATLTADFQKLHVPGAAVLILRDGVQIYAQGFGYTTLARSVAVTPSTHFEIGSVTKQFTAAAILQLRDAGKLSLDDKVSRFVPQYAHARDVTIRQLLLQVSGIPNFTEGNDFIHVATTQPGGLAAILARINTKPLDFAPGTKWEYSNSNYELLGRIVAKASGQRYAAYMRSNILDRAGMRDTATIADESRLPAMASGYITVANKPAPAPILKDSWAGAAGNLVSTVVDLAKWDNAYFSGRIISLADVAEATTPVPLVTGAPSSYVYGWTRDKELGLTRIWHNGGTFGFGAYNAVFPQKHVAIVVLLNNADAEPESIGAIVLNTLYPNAAKAVLAPAPGADATVTARAESELAQAASGHYDRTQLTAAMSHALTPQMVNSVAAQLQPLGKPTAFIFKKKTPRIGAMTYEYLVTYAQPGAQFYLTMTLDSANKVAGFYISNSP